jgi:hypothetical protein
MSWQIPTQIEQDIICGKAVYRTYQTGNGGQSILQVPANSYAVIFGYDFSPAGGGITSNNLQLTDAQLNTDILRWFETQQISFYTGNDFYPFIHHVNIEASAFTAVAGTNVVQTVDNSPICRQVYITSTNDVTITVGLILGYVQALNAIPVTNRTPPALTYGGSGQVISTQTNMGPILTPQSFIQPTTKDFDNFGFGPLPNNPDDQAFATPNTTRGLLDPSLYLDGLGIQFRDAAACNYFLNVHYALYTQTIPEQRG